MTTPPYVPIQPYAPSIDGYFKPLPDMPARSVFTPPGPDGLYDQPGSIMKINPNSIGMAVISVQSITTSLLNSVSVINVTLGNLALSWVGQSATDAQNFTDQWNTEMQKFLDAMNTFINAIDAAGNNYSVCEGTLENALSQVADQLEATVAAAGSSSAPPAPTSASQTTPPITETY